MQIPQEKIDELQRKTNIQDFNNVRLSEYENIYKLVDKKVLGQNDLALLTAIIPNIVELQKSSIDGLKEVVGGAKDTQKSAFTTLDGLIQVLDTLAKNAESDETRLKMADILMNIFKEMKEINSDNNSVWKSLAIGSAAFLFSLGAYLFSKKE